MTTNNLSFNPNWVSPPGSTLNDLIEHQGQSLSEFAKCMQWGANELKKLIKGQTLIDFSIASKLENVTGTSAKFWLEREKLYRKSVEKLERQNKLENEWLSKLPTADMAKFGWMKSISNKSEKLIACFNFFGVFSIEEWEDKYNDLLTETAFRTSQAFDSSNEAIASWLRQGEIEARRITCAKWDKNALIELIPEIRLLSTIERPDHFLPKLKDYLSKCGVAFAVVRSPKGCSASGATFWPTPNNPILILSFRHLSDDHFWFTLFHEIGHLILHPNYRLILETNENSKLDIENEANKFSENILIPEQYQQELMTFRAKDLRKIVKFSKKINTSKGIVVGQLQNKGVIPNNYLNKLKVRYSW